MQKLLVVLIVFVSLGRIAGAAEPRAYVERMFAAERSKAGQAAASAAYAGLQKSAPNDPRVDYACALALVRQQPVSGQVLAGMALILAAAIAGKRLAAAVPKR